jgi:hypothetical protein
LDRIDPEVVEAGEGLDDRPEDDETFHKGNKRGKIENGIARKMVGLKFIKVKEALEKVRRRKAKAALKMGGKDNYLARLGAGSTSLPGIRQNTSSGILRDRYSQSISAWLTDEPFQAPRVYEERSIPAELASAPWLELPADDPQV